jgi:hypothetical protein
MDPIPVDRFLQNKRAALAELYKGNF